MSVNPAGGARAFRVAPPGAPAATQRWRATVAYDGTAYSGWQVQPGHRSVQGEMERALEGLSLGQPRVHASGRTDQGVHAAGQVVHFDLPVRAERRRLHLGLNALLPDDIRVLDVREAPDDFHARFSATGKEYRYHIWNGPVPLPFAARYRAWERVPLDTVAMRRAARRLVGRHDFAAFSANPNREIEGTVRHLRALDVRKRGREIVIVARGDGFLYKMVRSLAGFLIRVGRGDLPPGTADEILASRVRTARVPTAPPQGLFLWRVEYPRLKRPASRTILRAHASPTTDHAS